MVSQEDLAIVVENTPDLMDTGFRHDSFWDRNMTKEQRIERIRGGREALKTLLFDEFKRSCEWLETAIKIKTFNERYGSYGLKHKVERWSKRNGINDNYVHTGAFIAAAIHMGFECKPIFDSPNAYFNISSKSPLIQEDKSLHYDE